MSVLIREEDIHRAINELHVKIEKIAQGTLRTEEVFELTKKDVKIVRSALEDHLHGHILKENCEECILNDDLTDFLKRFPEEKE